MSGKQERRRRQATREDSARFVWDVCGQGKTVKQKVEAIAFGDYLVKRLFCEPADPPAFMTPAQVDRIERACATPARRARVLTWALGVTAEMKAEVQQWVDEGGAA